MLPRAYDPHPPPGPQPLMPDCTPFTFPIGRRAGTPLLLPPYRASLAPRAWDALRAAVGSINVMTKNMKNSYRRSGSESILSTVVCWYWTVPPRR